MRLTAPKSIVRVGDVEIHGVQHILELDSREADDPHSSELASPCPDRDLPIHSQQHKAHIQQEHSPPSETQAVPSAALHAIQSRTAIVVPCKDECLERIAGVWAAIPASSLIILVSGSSVESFARERNALIEFCRLTGREGIAVCQRAPEVAEALLEAGMKELLDDDQDGLVYSGKGEGLLIGIALAAAARGPRRIQTEEQWQDECLSHSQEVDDAFCGDTSVHTDSAGAPGYYKYIGFIDADNFVPGTVQEYCRAFSAGLYLAQAQDAMVRISWGSKPKVRDGKLEFKRCGRSSEIVNRWLNSLVRSMDGVSIVEVGGTTIDNHKDGDGIICTGNAGEHAMTISLALKLRLASGYAIEPFHFLDIWERFAQQVDILKSTGVVDEVQCCRDKDDEQIMSWRTQLPASPISLSPLTSPIATPVDRSPVLSAADDSTLLTSPSVFSAAPMAPNVTLPLCQQLPLPPSARPIPRIIKTSVDVIGVSCNEDGSGGQPGICAGMTPPISPVSPSGPQVQILQIRTLNPHFHEDKGEAHVLRMWRQGLSALYHSPVTTDSPSLVQFREKLRTVILRGEDGDKTSSPPTPSYSISLSASATLPPSWLSNDEKQRRMHLERNDEATLLPAADWQPERCRIYPPVETMRLKVFMNRMDPRSASFWSSACVCKAEEEERLSESMLDHPEFGFDSAALLGLGPISREKRPEGDVDRFKAFVDESGGSV